MEEKLIIEKARISFGSFLKLSVVMGFCLGVLVGLVSILADVIHLVGGDPDVTTSGVLLNFVMIITGPITGVITGIFSYPIYKLLVNKKFTMSLTIYKLP